MSGWAQGREIVTQLIERGELERVAVNANHCNSLLSKAALHLESAEQLRTLDPDQAFAAAYDSARKALTALLAAQGLRPTSRGGHIVVAETALAQFEPPLGPHIKPFNWMRRTRNAVEYPNENTPDISTEEVDEATQYARKILDIAQTLLPQLSKF